MRSKSGSSLSFSIFGSFCPGASPDMLFHKKHCFIGGSRILTNQVARYINRCCKQITSLSLFLTALLSWWSWWCSCVRHVAFRRNFFVCFGKYDSPLYLYCTFPRKYSTDLSFECFRTSVIEINHMAEQFVFGSSTCRPLDRLPLISDL